MHFSRQKPATSINPGLQRLHSVKLVHDSHKGTHFLHLKSFGS